MNFEQCVALVIDIEQGFINDPKDPGGATKFGISQRSYPDLNIETLTLAQADTIYKRDFWDKYLVDQMPEVLRLIFFDCAVNQGQGFAAHTLQKILGVPVDGLIGAGTIAKLSSFHDLDILDAFVKRRLEEYIADKNFHLDGVGWIRRLVTMTLKTIR